MSWRERKPSLRATATLLAMFATVQESPCQHNDQSLFGCALTWCPDLDRDGRPDLVVSSPLAGPEGRGEIELISSRSGETLSRCSAPADVMSFGTELWGAAWTSSNIPADTRVLALCRDDPPDGFDHPILAALEPSKCKVVWRQTLEGASKSRLEVACAFSGASTPAVPAWLVVTLEDRGTKRAAVLRSIASATGESTDITKWEAPKRAPNDDLALSSIDSKDAGGLALVSYTQDALMIRIADGSIQTRVHPTPAKGTTLRITNNCLIADITGDGVPDLALATEVTETETGSRSGNLSWYSGKDGAFLRDIDPSLCERGLGHCILAAHRHGHGEELLLSRYAPVVGTFVAYVSSKNGRIIGDPVLGDWAIPAPGWALAELPDREGAFDVCVVSLSPGARGMPGQGLRLYSSQRKDPIWSRQLPMR